jgi:secreted PhoX family phosphatase
MVAVDPTTGETRRFLTSPPRCEVTGIVFAPDMTTMWLNIQHPGEDASASNPTQYSRWPDMDPMSRPRSSTVVITKNDGGVIGT